MTYTAPESLRACLDRPLGDLFKLLPGRYPEATLEEVFSNSQTLEDLLLAILRNQEAIEFVSKNSFVHPHGAKKIVLLGENNDLPQLRIHVWEASPHSKNEESIHDHKWDFISKIISGAVKNTTYSIDSRRNGSHRKYVLTTNDNNRGVSQKGRCSVYEVDDVVMVPGNRYCMLTNVLHQIRPVATYSATLFLRSRYLSSSTSVVLPAAMELQGPTGFVRMSAEEIQSELNRILQNIKSSNLESRMELPSNA